MGKASSEWVIGGEIMRLYFMEAPAGLWPRRGCARGEGLAQVC